MKILILGGTRFFGKRLAELLMRHGHHVATATRGNDPVPSSSTIQRILLKRDDFESLKKTAKMGPWDIVFDQICFSPNSAEKACRAFRDWTRRYIFTSTTSVYFGDGNRPETDFDPFSYPILSGESSNFRYAEGKRLAEAFFFQNAPFPLCAMRIPIVLGSDDFTGRLEFHIERIRQGRSIVIPRLEAQTVFISSSEAARFLFWLSESEITGPINACSQGRITIQEVLRLIEEQVGRRALITTTGPIQDTTPFVDSRSRGLDTTRAERLGFQFAPLMSWLPALVKDVAAIDHGRNK